MADDLNVQPQASGFVSMQGQVSQNDSIQMSATGGTAPYTFALTQIDDGLTLSIDANTGQISNVSISESSNPNYANETLYGNPITSDMFLFTVTATDADGNTGTAVNFVSVRPISSVPSVSGSIRRITKKNPCMDKFVAFDLDFFSLFANSINSSGDTGPLQTFVNYPELRLTNYSANQSIDGNPLVVLTLPVGRIVNKLNGLDNVRSLIFYFRPSWGSSNTVGASNGGFDFGTNSGEPLTVLTITNVSTLQTLALPGQVDYQNEYFNGMISGAIPFFGDDSTEVRVIKTSESTVSPYGSGKLRLMFCDFDVRPYYVKGPMTADNTL